MPQGKFSAQVNDWVRETQARMEAVYRESVQRTVTVMQTPVAEGGNLPTKTGFMRFSLQAVIGTALPPLRDRPKADATYAYDAGQVNLVIAGAKVTDTITAAYGAKYAIVQEYRGNRFVALAAQQWPRIVSEVAAEAQAGAKR